MTLKAIPSRAAATAEYPDNKTVEFSAVRGEDVRLLAQRARYY
jgi:hypothetical protein